MNDKIIIVTEGSFNNLSVAHNTNKLLKIVKNFFADIYLITYCNEKLINLSNDRIYNLNSANNFVLNSLLKQIQITSLILEIHKQKKIKTLMFAFGNDLAFMPFIFAKILGFKIILRSDGRASITTEHTLKNYRILKYLIRIIELIDYRLVDKFITEAGYMIEKYNLNNYNVQVGNLYIDSNFKKIKKIKDRKYDIGFIGRLEKQKQPLNFLKSLKMIDNDLNILMIGYGSEKSKVLEHINGLKNKKNIRINHLDWVKNEDLPNYLNDIKLLVAPSLWEGLPNTLIEAMACGCIILASDVGGVKELIKDGRTGFLLNEINPYSIYSNIIKILKNCELEKISDRAAKSSKNSFSYECTLKNWEKII